MNDLLRLKLALCLMLVLPLTGSAQTEPEPTEEEIEALVNDLSSPVFVQRQRATQMLWSMGLRAKPALERISDDLDAEARTRAVSILRDFAYGILPETPAHLREKIAQFRDVTGVAQILAFQGLVKERAYPTLESLIRMQPRPDQRVTLLSQLFGDAEVAADYQDLTKVSELVARVGGDLTEQWRMDTEATVLFTPVFMAELARTGKLNDLHAHVAGKEEGVPRDTFVRRLFQNFQSVNILVRNGQHEFLFEMLKLEEAVEVRSEYVMSMTSGGFVTQALLEIGEFLPFLDRVKPLVTENVPEEILMATFAPGRPTRAIATMLTRHGFEKLIQLSDHVQDSENRGKLLGMIMSDQAVIRYLHAQKDLSRIMTMAIDEKDEKARQSYISAILDSNAMTFIEEVGSTEILVSIWRLVKECDDPAIQDRAIRRFMTRPTFVRLLRDEKEAPKIIETLENLDANTLSMVISSFTFNDEGVALLSNPEILTKIVKLVGKLPPWTRTQRLSRLFNDGDFFKDVKPQRRLEILNSVVDQLEPAFQCDFVGAVLRSHLVNSQNTELAHRMLDRLLKVPATVKGRALEALAANIVGPRWIDEEKKMEWVFDGLASAKPQTVYSLMLNVLRDAKQQQMFFDTGGVDLLMKQFSRLDPQQARDVANALTRSAAMAPWLTEQGKGAKLLTLVTSIERPSVRHGALRGIFSNYRLMPILVADKSIDGIIELIDSEQDPKTQAQLWADLLQSSAAVTYLIEADRADQIMSFMNDDWSVEQRHVFLMGVLKSSTVVRQIVKDGQFDQVIDLIIETEDSERQAELLNTVLSSYEVIGQLVARQRLVEVFELRKQFGASPDFVRVLTRRPDAIAEFGRTGKLKEFIEWIRDNLGPPHRQFALGGLWYSEHNVDLLIKHKVVDLVLDSMASQGRIPPSSYLYAVVSREPSVKALVKSGYLDRLLALVHSPNRQPDSRLCSELFHHVTVINELARLDRMHEMIDIVNRISSAARRGVISRILSNSDAVRAIADAGFLDSMFSWADEEPSASYKQTWLASITEGIGAAEMIRAQRVDALMIMASNSATGSRIVQSMVSSKSSIEAINQSGHFETLIEICEQSDRRPTMLLAVLDSPHAVSLLDKKRIQPWISDILDEQDKAIVSKLLEMASSKHHFRKLIVEAGQFASLVTHAQTQSTISTDVVKLLTTSEGTRWMIDEKQCQVLQEVILGEKDDSRRMSILGQLSSHPKGYYCLFHGNTADTVKKIFASFPKSLEDQVANYLLYNSNGVVQWALAGNLESYLEFVKDAKPTQLPSAVNGILRSSELAPRFADEEFYATVQRLLSMLDTTYQTSYRDQLGTNSNIRWALLTAGKHELLKEIAEQSSDPARTRNTQLFSPSGEVAYLISKQQFDEAEALLLEHAGGVENWAALATYYSLRGMIDQRADAFLKQPEREQLACYLLRCSERYDEAIGHYEKLDDRSALFQTYVESGLRNEATRELLSLRGLDENDPSMERIDLLGAVQLMTLNRREQQDKFFERSVAWIQRYAGATSNVDEKLRGAQALLMNHRVDEALQIIKASDPIVYFETLCRIGRYREGLEAIGFDDSDVMKWFRALELSSNAIEARIEAAIKIAGQLDALGKTDVANKLTDFAIEKFGTLRETTQTRRLQGFLARALMRADRLDDAIDIAYSGKSSFSSSIEGFRILYPEIYTSRQPEVVGWWNHFMMNRGRYGVSFSSQMQNPAVLREIFHKVRAILLGLPVTHRGETVSARQFVQDSSGSRHREFMGMTMIHLGDIEPGIEVLEQSQRDDLFHRGMVAQGYRLAEQWNKAAELYLKLYENDRQRIEYLALSGDSLLHAGDEKTGRERIGLASSLAVGLEFRMFFAEALNRQGAKELAADEYLRIVRSTSHGSPQRMQCMQRLTADLSKDSPVTEHLEEQVYEFLTRANRTTIPSAISLASRIAHFKALSNIASDKPAAAIPNIEYSIQLSGSLVSLSEHVVPLLQQKGKKELAQQAFDQQNAVLTRLCTEFPESALLLNNHAWMCAKARRDLDTALSHAQSAVRLRPRAGFIDTLAEVHHQRGETRQAVEQIQRAIDLEPLNPYFREQLSRYESKK